MHRQGLLLPTVVTVTLTILSLWKAGWFEQPAAAADLPRPSLALPAGPTAAEASAEHRYHVGGVRHWRACLIQR